jgi:hypothetical protein
VLCANGNLGNLDAPPPNGRDDMATIFGIMF